MPLPLLLPANLDLFARGGKPVVPPLGAVASRTAADQRCRIKTNMAA